MDIGEDLRRYIIDDLGWSGRAEDLTDDYPLIDNDVIDSMGIFELIEMLENRYGIEIDQDEIVVDNFGSIARIARLVSDRTG